MLDDDAILEEPYAQALLFMNYRPDVIVTAVKAMHRRREYVNARTLAIEVEKQQKKGSNVPGMNSRHGDSLSESPLEYDPNLELGGESTFNSHDLQADCETQPIREQVHKASHRQSPKATSTVQVTMDKSLVQLRLQVQRCENRRLRARQLCRSCCSRPVSITFLPCSHFAYCFSCGQNCPACPVCRRTILADVRTFLA